MAPRTSAQGAGQQSRGSKRVHVTVACENCRIAKVKCDGCRPTCTRCANREWNCEYTAEPDAPPIIALKRKHDALQRQSTEVNRLLSHIKSVSQIDAYRIIEFFRKDNDVASTLEFARALPAPDAPAEHILTTFRSENVASGSLTAVPYGGFSSSATVALDLNAGRDRHDRIIPPGSSCAKGSSTDALPPISSLLASVDALEDLVPQRRTRMRRSPSAPDLHPNTTYDAVRTASAQIWCCDSRLDHVRARDWGVTYIDDAGFRNIISSYLIWDHQSGRAFDEDDFLDGLLHRQSESCSECLVHTVLAYGSLNYVHVDSKAAMSVHKAAWREAEKLFNAALEKDDKIADAAAGMLIWALHSFNGTDKLGLKFLLQTRHTGTNMGLYDEALASRVYDPSCPRVSRARAIHAWGIYNWVTMAEFAFLSDLGFPKPPPVSMPRLAPRPSTDRWVPWPWPRVAMISPTLINETSAARSSLSPILKDIVPLRRRHLNAPLTMSFLVAATKIYERLCTWWDGIHPSLRSLDVLDEAPPHVFMVACLYNFAIQEVFRPFTTTPDIPAAHSAPLIDASLPTEPAMSAALSAAIRQRGLLRRIFELHGHDQIMGFFIFFTWPVAYETLSSASHQSPSFSVEARDAFLAVLRLIRHAGRQYPVMQYAALGIQQTAVKIAVALPLEAEEIFADIKGMIAANKDRDIGRSDWVVVFNTASTDVQGSRLNHLITELNKLQT